MVATYMLPLNTRRAIYITFIILFLITAPLLIFYTAGYRFNWTKKSIQQVGSISIQPYPTTAEIFLNNQLQLNARQSNTLRISNLLPGEYQIKIALTGYHSWEKNLKVISNLNTFVNQVVLFKNSLPENIVAMTLTDQQLISLDNKKLALVANNKLEIFDLETEQISTWDESAKNTKSISWSADGANLLTSQNDRFIIYPANNPQTKIILDNQLKTPWEKIKWQDDSNYLLTGKVKNSFYQINIITKEYRRLYELTADQTTTNEDFLLENNNIFFTANNDDGYSINKKDLNSESAIATTKIFQLSNNYHFEFLANNNGTIILVDKNKNKFFLFNADLSKLIFEGDGKNFSWSTDNNRLIYFNNFEIWLYNLQNNNSQLLARYGQEIKNASFLPKIEYLAFLAGDTLKIAEFDDRGERNTIDVATAENINDFFIQSKGKNIFFLGQVGGQEGLYKINTQE